MSTPNQTPSEQDKEIATAAAYEILAWEREYGRDADKADMEPFILSAITKSKACEQAKAELWTVEQGNDKFTVWNINTGKEVLQMVTDDYQMAIDLVDAHNATLI